MGNLLNTSTNNNEFPRGPPQDIVDDNTKLILIEGFLREIDSIHEIIPHVLIKLISDHFRQFEDLGLQIGQKGKLVSGTNVWSQYSPSIGVERVSHSLETQSQFIVSDTYTIPHHDSNGILIQVIITKPYTRSFPQIAHEYARNKTKCYIEYESTNLYKPRKRDIAINKLIEERKSNHNGLIKTKLSTRYEPALYKDHRRIEKLHISQDIKNGDECILIAPELMQCKTYSACYIYLPKLDIYGWSNVDALKSELFKAKAELNKNNIDGKNDDEESKLIHSEPFNRLYSDPCKYDIDLTGNTVYCTQLLYQLRCLSREVKHGMINVCDNEANRWGWYNIPVWIPLESVHANHKIDFIDKRKVNNIFIDNDFDERKDDVIKKGTKGKIIKTKVKGCFTLDPSISAYGLDCNYSENNIFEIVSDGCVQGKSDNNYQIKIKLLSNEFNSQIDFEALTKDAWIPLHCTNLYKRNEYIVKCNKMVGQFELILKNEENIEEYLTKNNYTKSHVHYVQYLHAEYYGFSDLRSDRKYTAILDKREEIYLIAPCIDDIQFGDTMCVYSVKRNVLGWVKCVDTGFKRHSNADGNKVGCIPRMLTYASVDPFIPIMCYEQHYASVISLHQRETVNGVTYLKVQGESIDSPLYKEWFWCQESYVFTH